MRGANQRFLQGFARMWPSREARVIPQEAAKVGRCRGGVGWKYLPVGCRSPSGDGDVLS